MYQGIYTGNKPSVVPTSTRDRKLSSLPASLSKGDEIPGAVTIKSVQKVPRPNAASGNSREEKEMKD